MELLVTLGPILRYSVTSARRIGVSQLLVSKCKKLACYLKHCFFVSVVQIYRLERNIFQKIVFQYRFKPLSNSFRHWYFMLCPIPFDGIYLNLSTILFELSMLALGISANPKASLSQYFQLPTLNFRSLPGLSTSFIFSIVYCDFVDLSSKFFVSAIVSFAFDLLAGNWASWQ